MKNKKYILSLIAVAVLIILYLVFQDKIDAILNEGQGSGPDYTVTADSQQGSQGTADTVSSSDNGGGDTAQADPDEGPADQAPSDTEYVTYKFRTDKLLTQHYEKHGIEMGFDSKEAYERAASDVVNNPAALTKIEKEDGDYVYYVEETNEFVILSTDGFLRTYFLPSAGKSYYDRQ